MSILTDIAIQLLVLEGLPFLALVYYLLHKKQMYMLEKGIEVKDDRKVRAERRIINGLFLTLVGISMILAPSIATAAGIQTHLSFELFFAGLIVLCAGAALLIGSGLLKYRAELADLPEEEHGLANLK